MGKITPSKNELKVMCRLEDLADAELYALHKNYLDWKKGDKAKIAPLFQELHDLLTDRADFWYSCYGWLGDFICAECAGRWSAIHKRRKLKAYCVSDPDACTDWDSGHPSEIVFDYTPSKARYRAYCYGDHFYNGGYDDGDWARCLKVKRMPKLDKLCHEDRPYVEYKEDVLREAGFHFDEDFWCCSCSSHYPNGTEGVCHDCECCPTCKHEDDCPHYAGEDPIGLVKATPVETEPPVAKEYVVVPVTPLTGPLGDSPRFLSPEQAQAVEKTIRKWPKWMKKIGVGKNW